MFGLGVTGVWHSFCAIGTKRMAKSFTQLCKTYKLMRSTSKSRAQRILEYRKWNNWDEQMIPNSDICIWSWVINRTLTRTKEHTGFLKQLKGFLNTWFCKAHYRIMVYFSTRYWLWIYHLTNTSLWNTVVSDTRV